MNRLKLLAVGLAGFAAAAQVGAQTVRAATSIEDPNIKNAVTAYAIRYHKLVMSSQARPGANYLPTGIYKDGEGHTITVKDGAVTYFTFGAHFAAEIDSTRLTPERRVQLWGRQTSVGHHYAGEGFMLFNASYTSEDGRDTFTLVDSKPVSFVFTSIPLPTTTTTTQVQTTTSTIKR